jgi:hypothetical protein
MTAAVAFDLWPQTGQASIGAEEPVAGFDEALGGPPGSLFDLGYEVGADVDEAREGGL